MTEYTRDELDVPVPPSPLREDFGYTGQQFVPGEFLIEELNFDDGTIEIVLAGSMQTPEVTASSRDFPVEDVLWTAVYWARNYGVPGVWKERIEVHDGDTVMSFRLGGLYRYAGFDLTERESDYETYGENPYSP